MKRTLEKSLALILCMYATMLIAQQSTGPAGTGVTPAEMADPDDEGYNSFWDGISTQLIKSRIPHGILYDRVYPYADLEGLEAGDIVSKQRLLQAWWELENSRVDITARVSNKRYSSIETRANNDNVSPALINLLAIRYDYATIDPNSVSSGRLSLNNGVLKDNNLPQTPYNTKIARLAALTVERVKAGKVYSISLDATNILSNAAAPEQISKVTVTNETTNQSFDISVGQTVSYTFSQVGTNTLKFTLVSAGGSSFYTRQQITVDRLIVARPFCSADFIVESDIPFRGYDESEATTSIADYHVMYHFDPSGSCEQVLKKPVIIVDGYDPQDERDHNVTYNNSLVTSDSKENIGEKLRQQGYDVIILNFPVIGSDKIANKRLVKNQNGQLVDRYNRDGGVDYIERNAFLLVKLIQKVNAELIQNGSAEKLVVVGPSMGGLISRYALAYMEKQNMNHNVRLYISFDSPHHGANITYCAQMLLTKLKNVKMLSTMYNTMLRCPAARQMLIEQVDGRNNTSSFRTSFMNALAGNGISGSNGWPVNLRKVSLVNGSGSGSGFSAPGSTFAEAEVKARNGFNQLVSTTNIKANFMPAPNMNGTIFSLKITPPKLLGLFTVAPSLNFKSDITNINPRGCMESVPGGALPIEDFPMDLKNGIEGSYKLGKFGSITWSAYLLNMSFIPTMSSLGFKNPDFNWASAVNNRNLSCSNEIYFDTYYLQNSNQSHVSLTAASAAWVLEEIRKGQPNCPKLCFANSDITGCDAFNVATTKTYSINGTIPPGVTVNWIATGSLEIVSGSGGTVTIKSKSSAGPGVLTAELVNPCGNNLKISKNINIGLNSPATFRIENTPTPAKKTVFVTLYDNGLPYDWTITVYDNFRKVFSTKSGKGGITDYGTLIYNNYYLSVSSSYSSGTCGYLGGPYYYYQLINGVLQPVAINPADKKAVTDESTSLPDAVLYPNPVNNELYIQLNPSLSGNVNYSIDVYSALGVHCIRQNTEISNRAATKISTADLKNGIYFVVIHDPQGNQLEKYKVVVSH